MHACARACTVFQRIVFPFSSSFRKRGHRVVRHPINSNVFLKHVSEIYSAMFIRSHNNSF